MGDCGRWVNNALSVAIRSSAILVRSSYCPLSLKVLGFACFLAGFWGFLLTKKSATPQFDNIGRRFTEPDNSVQLTCPRLKGLPLLNRVIMVDVHLAGDCSALLGAVVEDAPDNPLRNSNPCPWVAAVRRKSWGVAGVCRLSPMLTGCLA